MIDHFEGIGQKPSLTSISATRYTGSLARCCLTLRLTKRQKPRIGIDSVQVFDRNVFALKRRHAAINDEFRAQHESGFRRRQIKNSGGNLLRRTKAFERNLALNPIFGFLNFILGSISQKR